MATDIVPIPPPIDATLAETMTDLAGQLAPTTTSTYRYDMQHFAAWLAGEHLTVATLDRAAFIRYRTHLQDTYAKSTASRMLTIARRLLAEAVKRGVPSPLTFSIKKANITANHAYGMTAAGVAANFATLTPASSPDALTLFG